MPPLALSPFGQKPSIFEKLKEAWLAVFSPEFRSANDGTTFIDTVTIEQLTNQTDLPELSKIYASGSKERTLLFQRENAAGLAVKIMARNIDDNTQTEENILLIKPKGIELNLYCVIPNQIGSYNILTLTFEEKRPGLFGLVQYATDAQCGGHALMLIGDKRHQKCLYDYSEMNSLGDYLNVFKQRESWLRTERQTAPPSPKLIEPQ